MLEEIASYQEQIAKAQTRLGIHDPLEIPLFHGRPGGPNKLVKLDPFFFISHEKLLQLKHKFIPYRLTEHRVRVWLYKRYAQKNPQRWSGIKESIAKFIKLFQNIFARTAPSASTQLFLIKEYFSSLKEEGEIADLIAAFVTFLEGHCITLNTDIPVYYARRDLEKLGGEVTGLDDYFENSPSGYNLTVYYSSVELLLKNKSHPELWRQLRAIAPPSATQYIFKTGHENARENLISQLVGKLSLSFFLMPKEKVKIKGIRIQGEKKQPWQTEDDIEGLVCKFVKNDADKLWHSNYHKYLSMNNHLQKYSYLPEKKQKAERLKKALRRYEKRLKKLQLQESLEGNLLLDLIFGSYDSHFGQYKVMNGHLVNIDFSRFGLPCETYAIGNQTFAGLCSCLLDNPHVEESIHDTTRQIIESWDLAEIASSLQTYVGDFALFSKAKKYMKELRLDLHTTQLAKEEQIPYKFYCQFKKHAEYMTVSQQRKLICQKLLHQSRLLKDELFEKLHPLAFDAIMKRLATVKQAVRVNPVISLKEIFTELYPQFSPFYNYMRAMALSAGIGIAFKPGRTSLERICLEEIASKVAVELAQKEALPQLRASIEQMRRGSLEHADLAFIGEIFF